MRGSLHRHWRIKVTCVVSGRFTIKHALLLVLGSKLILPTRLTVHYLVKLIIGGTVYGI